ncbi:MAG: hypothetical protein WAO15_25140 [Mycobacterium sp.]
MLSGGRKVFAIADVVVTSLGSIRNVEGLDVPGLAAGPWGGL